MKVRIRPYQCLSKRREIANVSRRNKGKRGLKLVPKNFRWSFGGDRVDGAFGGDGERKSVSVSNRNENESVNIGDANDSA